MKNWKKEIFSIPNILSFFRLLLIPVYITIYLNATTQEHYILAATILAVSCLTDLVDGKIARKFNMITTLGKILDPLADKATQLALILCLAIRNPLLWILIALFVAKEGFMVIAGGIRMKKGQMLKGALMTGKICTTILFISLIVMVLLPGLSDTARLIIVCVDILFMLISLTDYVITYICKDSRFQAVDVPKRTK